MPACAAPAAQSRDIFQPFQTDSSDPRLTKAKRSSRHREVVRRGRRKTAPVLIIKRALHFRRATDGAFSTRSRLILRCNCLLPEVWSDARPELSNFQSFWGRCEPKTGRYLTIFGSPEAQRTSSDQSRCHLPPPPSHKLPTPR